MPLTTAIIQYNDHLIAGGAATLTVSAYMRDLRSLAAVLPATDNITGITPGMLDTALTDPAITTLPDGSPRSAATLHRLKAAVRSFFSWAEQTELIVSNPARFLKLHRIPAQTPDFLTDAERNRLLKTIRQSATRDAKRDRVIFELFLGTGIRLQELTNLDIADVDLDSKHVRIVGKGAIPQVKFLKNDLRTLLASYIKDRKKQTTCEVTALFISNRGERLCSRQIARRLDHWLIAAGIQKSLGPHALRHTFATQLYNRTGDILLVQRALNHADIGTTKVYTHLADEDLEAAIEML